MNFYMNRQSAQRRKFIKDDSDSEDGDTIILNDSPTPRRKKGKRTHDETLINRSNSEPVEVNIQMKSEDNLSIKFARNKYVPKKIPQQNKEYFKTEIADGKYFVVGLFNGEVRIQLREYEHSKDQKLFPTKK